MVKIKTTTRREESEKKSKEKKFTTQNLQYKTLGHSVDFVNFEIGSFEHASRKE